MGEEIIDRNTDIVLRKTNNGISVKLSKGNIRKRNDGWDWTNVSAGGKRSGRGLWKRKVYQGSLKDERKRDYWIAINLLPR